MIHKAVRNLPAVVIVALSAAKDTRFYVALTFSGSQKDVPSSATLHHTLCNVMVLVLVAVARQFGMILIPFKVRPHLIADLAKIRVVRQIISALYIFEGTIQWLAYSKCCV